MKEIVRPLLRVRKKKARPKKYEDDPKRRREEQEEEDDDDYEDFPESSTGYKKNKGKGKPREAEGEEEDDDYQDFLESSSGHRKWNKKGKRRSSKRAKANSPFDVSPNKMDMETFKAANPFISVVLSTDFPPFEGDKVMDGKTMNAEALYTALATIVPTSVHIARAFKDQSIESGLSHHINLAVGF